MSKVSLLNSSHRRISLLLVALVFLSTAISLAVTGFKFGINNNVFHIPYVLRFSEMPIFGNDALFQSLNKFTSLIWPLIRSLSNEQNIEGIFFLSHILSRAAAFAALCWFFRVNGAAATSSVLISLIVSAVCPWLIGGSSVGGHGLFVEYFTHSEATWGPLIAALVSAQLGRLTLAAVFTGIVFSINAFVGMWLAAILAICVAGNVDQRTDWRLLVKSALTFVLVCTPVLAWIIISITDKANVPTYSYIDYIRKYYPDHFLIEATTLSSLRDLAVILYCGIVAALLHTNKKFWVTTLAACSTLLIIGAILPYLINNRFIFNLHFIRAAGVLQFIAMILTISASAAILMNPENGTSSRVIATLALGSLMSMERESLYLVTCAACLSYLALIKLHDTSTKSHSVPKLLILHREIVAGTLVLFALLLDFSYIGFSNSAIARWILMFCIMMQLIINSNNPRNNNIIILILWSILALVISGTALMWRAAASKKTNALNLSNLEMTRWVQKSELVGPFLFPIERPYSVMFNEFQLNARKPVWVDLKQGGAVMWEPSFYWQWMPRFQEVKALRTVEDFTKYAIKNRIPNLVLPRSIGECHNSTHSSFQNEMFVICTIKGD